MSDNTKSESKSDKPQSTDVTSSNELETKFKEYESVLRVLNVTSSNELEAKFKKYEDALTALAGGDLLAKIVASSTIEAKKPTNRQIINKFIKENLTISVIIALTGVVFTYWQVQQRNQELEQKRIENEQVAKQKEYEITVAKIETLGKLIPSLANSDTQIRQYALSALVLLYKENDEIELIANTLGDERDVEVLSYLTSRLKTDKDNTARLKKRTAAFFVRRAETKKDYADESPNNRQNFYKSALCDAERAIKLEPMPAAQTLIEKIHTSYKNITLDAGCN